MAIAYFGANGNTVSIPLNDTQDYDLVVDIDEYCCTWCENCFIEDHDIEESDADVTTLFV